MKKVLLSLVFTFLIIFNSFMPRIVYANSLVVPATSELLAIAPIIGASIASIAPPVALVACVAISAGVVYQNREELITMAGGLYRSLESAGYSISNTASDGLSLGADGVNFIKEQISSMSSTNTQSIPNVPVYGGHTVPAILGLVMTLTTSVQVDILREDLTKQLSVSFSDGTPLRVTLSADSTQQYLSYKFGSSWYNVTSWLVSESRVIRFPNDNSISFMPSYPSQTFQGDITGNLDGQTGTFPRTAPTEYIPDGSISIPTSLPLDYSPTASNDWVDDLVGTSDYTDAFPSDVPVDTVGDGITVPTDFGIPSSVPLTFAPLMDLGLTSKFPFSIPWDIRDSIATLVAPADAPVFDIDMTKWEGGTHYYIDFSMFDKLASIVRWGLLIAFNFGLMIKTRSIIRG